MLVQKVLLVVYVVSVLFFSSHTTITYLCLVKEFFKNLRSILYSTYSRPVTAFLKEARHLHPSPSPKSPEWDLTLMLKSLKTFTNEPMQDAKLKWVSL